MTLFGQTDPVQPSPDLHRVLALPRRVYSDSEASALVQTYTKRLRTPRGGMTLKPVQAIGLHEVQSTGGLLCPIEVGGGKTLLSLLVFTVLQSKRSGLLLPAALLEKTRAEQEDLMRHWQISRGIFMFSYESLGRENMADYLDRMQFDVLVADEAHRLKNPKAGVTRRVLRRLDANRTVFVAMSGTLCKGSLSDVAPLAARALGEGSPYPLDAHTTEEWGDCVDEAVNPLRRRPPGELLALARDGTDLSAVRRGLGDRMRETRGVVSYATDAVGCSLYVSALRYSISDVAYGHFDTLRRLWETPDGWAFSDALTARRHARELALGMHYVWDPRPPDEWMEARRAWAKFCRQTIQRTQKVDTEKQIVTAIDAGDIRDPFRRLATWRETQPTFTINQKPVWHDEVTLNLCAKWLEKERGIVWCEHTFFARRLAEITGLPYFGAGATDAKGRHIREAKGPIIASIASCGTGQNLQAWSKGLVTAPPAGSAMWEQLLGRKHRDGQTADSVSYEVLWGCLEHAQAAHRALNGARMVQDTMGAPQKLCLADVTWPRPGVYPTGPQWAKQITDDERDDDE